MSDTAVLKSKEKMKSKRNHVRGKVYVKANVFMENQNGVHTHAKSGNFRILTVCSLCLYQFSVGLVKCKRKMRNGEVSICDARTT